MYPEIALRHARDILCDTRFGTLERTAVPLPPDSTDDLSRDSASRGPGRATCRREPQAHNLQQWRTPQVAGRAKAQPSIQTLQIAIKEFDTHGKPERFEQLLQAVAPHLPECRR